MKKELIIRSNSNAVDFAMLNEGRLIELDKEVGKNKFSVGDIFVAKIRKTIPGLNAAFVNVGHEKDGFLHYHDLGPKLLSLSKFVDQIDSKKVKSFNLFSGKDDHLGLLPGMVCLNHVGHLNFSRSQRLILFNDRRQQTSELLLREG